jgi:Holliday junction resolvasome RuvABC endonuclease subunit
MKIAGIDNSKNSPGIVKFELDENFKIINYSFLGLTINKTKKPKPLYQNCKIFEIFGLEPTDYDKINFMSSNIIEFTKDCDYVAFEDYAYAGKGSVFDIAESTGVLKHLLYNQNKYLRFYAPTQIKMFATNNGIADKPMMIQKYIDTFPSNPLNIPLDKINDHPFEDVIDAFWITTLLYTELSLRNGHIQLHQLNEQQIRPFNHISKSYKVNLLSQDFIFKNL